MFADQRDVVARLANLEQLQFRIFAELPEKPKQAVAMVIEGTEVYLPLAGMADMAAEQSRLTKEIADLDKQVAKLEGLLASDFANKAPAAVVEKERGRLASIKESRAKLAERLGG